MLHSQETILLEQDRQDLFVLLQIRFGDVPLSVTKAVNNVNKMDTLQRLILVAANATSWSVFMEELQAGDGSFKVVGERFSPL